MADSFVVSFRDRSKRSAKLPPQAYSPLDHNGIKPLSTKPDHLAFSIASHQRAASQRRQRDSFARRRIIVSAAARSKQPLVAIALASLGQPAARGDFRHRSPSSTQATSPHRQYFFSTEHWPRTHSLLKTTGADPTTSRLVPRVRLSTKPAGSRPDQEFF
jgi:hypothetical protein